MSCVAPSEMSLCCPVGQAKSVFRIKTQGLAAAAHWLLDWHYGIIFFHGKANVFGSIFCCSLCSLCTFRGLHSVSISLLSILFNFSWSFLWTFSAPSRQRTQLCLWMFWGFSKRALRAISKHSNSVNKGYMVLSLADRNVTTTRLPRPILVCQSSFFQ